ncbi:DUF2635 domain-containing protein [Pectobacterium cacticida]|uniref:DUF2635 domain-containing protein n=1 Tax=Pectobacterium cacticida TaxID=69221 RepID=A0ABZ2GEB1_9GAMM|nr:DUF2635 domain-containing protein [Pectobacterium cacticida]UYX06112.1 DUF2635 domain-containing protein [Pectobacterium cacticida]
MNKIKVKALPGVSVPREDNARRYITSDTLVEVERTAYYLRRIADGDLIDVTVEPLKVAGKKDKTEVNSGQS